MNPSLQRFSLTAAIGLALLSIALLPAPAKAQCTGVNHVVWPAVNPVWDFCWTRPSGSTPQPNGGGIQVTDVQYKGVTVLKDGNVPIVNDKYQTGGCGGSGLCYREWFDGERSFTCDPDSGSGYCDGTTTPASTVCDHPGTDAGTFSGVAVEDFGDHLTLTSQTAAGWMRFTSVWSFSLGGRIEPRVQFSEVDNGCVAYAHRHHAYFRFDLDVNGPSGNTADYYLPSGGAERLATEASFTDTSPDRSRWRFGASGSPVLVDVERNAADEAAGDSSSISGDFPVGDGWVLAYDTNELTDANGYSQLGACPALLDDFLNGQNVDGADLVLWTRGGAFHDAQPGGLATECSMPGPTITVREDELFADGVESGDLSGWSSAATDGGDLAVQGGAAALNGSFGLAATINDDHDLYVEDDTPVGELRYRVRFRLGPNSISLPDGLRTKILETFAASPSRHIITATFRHSVDHYEVLFKTHLDNDSWANTGWVTIPDQPVTLELDWQKAKRPGSNDGTMELWVDGTSRASVTGIDDDTAVIDSVRLGVMAPAPGAAGTIYFDSFDSHRISYVGP